LDIDVDLEHDPGAAERSWSVLHVIPSTFA